MGLIDTRSTRGVARTAVISALLMLVSGCAASSPESATDLKLSTATTGSTIDLFATTAPDLAVVVPTSAPQTTTTEATTTTAPPATAPTSTTSHPNRSHAGTGPVEGAIPEAFGPDGLLWIGTWSGFTEDLGDVTYVLAPDGSVLRIDEGNIYSGAGSYLTWNIGPVGYEAMTVLIDELGLATDRPDLTARGQYGDIRTNGTFGVHVANLNAPANDLTASQVQMRKSFRQLMAQLEDPSWLEGISTVTPRAPWVPDRLAVNVRGEYNPRYYSTDDFGWPFDRSIADMAGGEGADMWVCLEGADAATAWTTFMIDGVNNARLPLSEAGQQYEAGVRVSHAMYGGISPCPAATGFGTGVELD